MKFLFSPLVTEVWELENGNNKIIQPTIQDIDYAVGIALYVVEKDFCKKWFYISSKLLLEKELNKFIHWFKCNSPIKTWNSKILSKWSLGKIKFILKEGHKIVLWSHSPADFQKLNTFSSYHMSHMRYEFCIFNLKSKFWGLYSTY